MALNDVTLLTTAWLYGERRTCTETAAVSRGTSHVTTRQCCQCTAWLDIKKGTVKGYSWSSSDCLCQLGALIYIQVQWHKPVQFPDLHTHTYIYIGLCIILKEYCFFVYESSILCAWRMKTQQQAERRTNEEGILGLNVHRNHRHGLLGAGAGEEGGWGWGIGGGGARIGYLIIARPERSDPPKQATAPLPEQ